MAMLKSAMKEVSGGDPLATPTDLDHSKTAVIAREVNKLVADAFALYLKTKNIHWHASGPHFRDCHLMLDEQADQIFATIDPLAERVRKLGKRTILGISHVAELTSIKDNRAEFVPPLDMLKILLEDNESTAKKYA